MGKRGTKPKGQVKIEWSPNFAYAIGLLASDGCLYNDRRHMSLTTKDLEQAENFKNCLGLSVKIGKKSRGKEQEKKYYHVQFGDVLFYKFLESIGMTKAKSKTIGDLKIPKKYFFDFLRGLFDGDGHFYSYWDPRWKSSFMFYVCFSSASLAFIKWLQSELHNRLKINGHITKAHIKLCYQLKYAKKESLKILKRMYQDNAVHLSRKRLKIEKALGIVELTL